MNRPITAALLLAMSCLLAAFWTFRVQVGTQQRRMIKFSYLGSPEDARHVSALRLKARVEEKSAGALGVQLYYGGQLGGDRDSIEGVILGTIEMTVAGAGIFANFEPAMGVTALPFLFESSEEAWAFLDSPVSAEVERRLLARGIRVLGYWENGFRCVTNSVRPIHAPQDLRGLSIRTPENAVVIATMRALGASPSPLPWTELYMALQQRAFDGQENPVPTIYINKMYEVQKYLSTTDHVYEPMVLVISEAFWLGLSLEEQAILASAAEESQRFNRELVSRQREEMLVLLKEHGLVITHPDRGPFEEATSAIRAEFAESIGADLVDRAVQFVARRRAAAAAEAVP